MAAAAAAAAKRSGPAVGGGGGGARARPGPGLMGQVVAPLLVFQSERDTHVEPAGARRLVERAAVRRARGGEEEEEGVCGSHGWGGEGCGRRAVLGGHGAAGQQRHTRPVGC